MIQEDKLIQACLLSVIQNLIGDDNALTCNLKWLAKQSYFDIFTVIIAVGNLYMLDAIQIENFPSSDSQDMVLKINKLEKLKWK